MKKKIRYFFAISLLILAGIIALNQQATEPYERFESQAADEIVNWYHFNNLERYDLWQSEDGWRGDFYFEDGLPGHAYVGTYDLMMSGFSQTIFSVNGFRMAREMPDFDLDMDWEAKPTVEVRLFIDDHLLTRNIMSLDHDKKEAYYSSFEDVKHITNHRIDNNFELKRFRDDLMERYPLISEITYERSVRYEAYKFFRFHSEEKLPDDVIEQIKEEIVSDLLMRETMEARPGTDDRPIEIDVTFYSGKGYYYGDALKVISGQWLGKLNELEESTDLESVKKTYEIYDLR